MNQQEYEFRELGPVWHLCTPGEHQCAIFRTREDFVFDKENDELLENVLLEELRYNLEN